MKKLLLSISLFLALLTNKTTAQVKDNLSFGPIIGFGHTTITGDLGGEAKRSFNPSYAIGMRLTYSANPHWGFSSDLSFKTEGAKFKSTTTDENIKFHPSYIRIDPKAFFFFSKPGQTFRPKIGLGPSFGFLVGGKIKYYERSALANEEKLGDFVKAFDFGLAGAIGFNYRIENSMWLNVDASYTHGLLDIAKENDEDAVCNRSFFLNVGVLFGIGKTTK